MDKEMLLTIQDQLYNTLSTTMSHLRGLFDSTLHVDERMRVQSGFLVSAIVENRSTDTLLGGNDVTRDMLMLSYSEEEEEIRCHICDPKIGREEMRRRINTAMNALSAKCKARVVHTPERTT